MKHTDTPPNALETARSDGELSTRHNTPMAPQNGIQALTDVQTAALSSHRAMYHKPPAKKRQGKTPEAKVSAAIDRYLAKIGALALRTSAGLVEVEGRKIQIGQAGVSDRTVLLPGGFWASVEIKATTKPTKAQQQYLNRVRTLGGLAVVAYSVEDLRAALIERFGLATVEQWEQSGKGRGR